MKPANNEPVVQPPFAQELARHWEGFVGCTARSSTMAPFLIRSLRLNRSSRVMDLAAGTGCDMVSLHDRGIPACGNEINAGLRCVAQEAFRRRGWNPGLYECDWCELTRVFQPGAFDAAFIVGNSLCLLGEERARSIAAREMRAILRRGGRLVVDERNFEYMLRSRNEILSGEFNYRRRVVYCGDEVHGRPVAIADDEVVFSYVHRRTGQEIGRLSMYAFKHHELRDLFERSGFRRVEVLGDLGASNTENADFIAHVFEAK